MITDAIDRILNLGERKVVDIEGRKYTISPQGLSAVKPPAAAMLEIHTLTGIVDYGPERDKHMIHVLSHNNVSIMDNDFIDNWLTRSTYVTAKHEEPTFRFNEFMLLENFIINLQAMFVPDETTAQMLKVIGNIKEEGVVQYSDDGVTQGVTAKNGLSLVERLPVPNPVTLRPYRTFMEIEQPASTFVFRMHSGAKEGTMPTCALFEADGRMWKLEAIKKIKDWLREKLPEIPIIA